MNRENDAPTEGGIIMTDSRGSRVAFLTAYGIVRGNIKEKTDTYVMLENVNIKHGDCKPISSRCVVLLMSQVIGWEYDSPETQKRDEGFIT